MEVKSAPSAERALMWMLGWVLTSQDAQRTKQCLTKTPWLDDLEYGNHGGKACALSAVFFIPHDAFIIPNDEQQQITTSPEGTNSERSHNARQPAHLPAERVYGLQCRNSAQANQNTPGGSLVVSGQAVLRMELSTLATQRDALIRPR